MGRKLKSIRILKGLSAKYVAEKLGISSQDMSNRENDRTQFKAIELVKLAVIYDIDVRELI